jgi:hypothetical protein
MSAVLSMQEPLGILHDFIEVPPPSESASRRETSPSGVLRDLVRGLASVLDWLFGFACLILFLSVLAALPILQFLTMGYFLESSARVTRRGRLRDGIIGVRRASRLGRTALGAWLCTLPTLLADSFANSAELIDPGGRVARAWRAVLFVVAAVSFLHIAFACIRGGRLRYFLWPIGNVLWLMKRLPDGGLYSSARDDFWNYVVSMRLPYYLRLGFLGFLGTFVWLAVPAMLIAAGGRVPPLGLIGALVLGFVAPSLPFLQVRYALEQSFSSLFSLRAVRDRFRRAPWAFALALLILVIAAIPLYLLKIEMIPREAAWLPSLVFVIFLAPAHLLVGWAYSRSIRREQPRHWFFRGLGRVAILPVAAFYVLVVFLTQYTSWGGYASLYEQHAFLLPVPFLSM